MAALHETDTPTEESPTVSPSSRAKKKTKRARRKKSAPKASQQTRVTVSAEQLPRKSLEQALRIPRTLRDVFAGGPAEWQDIARATNLSMAQQNKYYLWAALA